MKEFIVNLEHTTRQQVSILANTKEEAAMMLKDIYLGTDLLDDLPIVSKGSKIICGDAKIVIPNIRSTSNVICDNEDDDFSDIEDDEEIDITHDFSDAYDEVDAAIEHLQYALSKMGYQSE